MAQYARNKIEASKLLKLITPVESLNICFQIQPEAIQPSNWNNFNIQVREEILENGKIMVNYASIKDTTCFRLITSNFKLNQKDLDFFFSELEETVFSLLATK